MSGRAWAKSGRAWIRAAGLAAALGGAAIPILVNRGSAGVFGSGAMLDSAGLRRAISLGAAAPPFEDDGIRFLESRLRERDGKDPLARSRLARLRLARFKVSGNPGDLRRADSLYAAQLGSDSLEPSVLDGLSACRLAGHRFREALACARRALRVSGKDGRAAARMALFDALYACGRYQEAKAQLDSAAREDIAAGLETRRSRLQSRMGRFAAARASLAAGYARARAGAAAPPVLAWFAAETGNLEERGGRPREAARAYLEALDNCPGYPAALEGLARLTYTWDGNLAAADTLLAMAVRNGGAPALLLDRMRILAALGRDRSADSLRSSFLRMATTGAESERMNRRPLAMLFAETDSTRGRALEYATVDLEERPTPESEDCMAWVLYKRGSLASAYHYSRLAVPEKAGAPAMLCRASLIAWHAGKRREAAALLDSALARNGGRFAWKRSRPEKSRGLRESAGWEGMPASSARVDELLAFHTHGS